MLKYNKTLFFLSLLHKRCERLVKIVFCRRGVDDHQSFSISTQRVLHHLREMKHILVELLVYVGVQNWKTRILPFYFITCVSLLFLYGTWGSSADKAEITSPSALKDLLMEFASCTEENMEEFKEVMTNLSTTHWPMKQDRSRPSAGGPWHLFWLLAHCLPGLQGSASHCLHSHLSDSCSPTWCQQ